MGFYLYLFKLGILGHLYLTLVSLIVYEKLSASLTLCTASTPSSLSWGLWGSGVTLPPPSPPLSPYHFVSRSLSGFLCSLVFQVILSSSVSRAL